MPIDYYYRCCTQSASQPKAPVVIVDRCRSKEPKSSARDADAPATTPATHTKRYEEIELKCYSLTEGRALIDSGHHYRLVAPRTGDAFRLDESRKLLDVKPSRVSLIRLKIDPQTHRLDRDGISIREVRNSQGSSSDLESDSHSDSECDSHTNHSDSSGRNSSQSQLDATEIANQLMSVQVDLLETSGQVAGKTKKTKSTDQSGHKWHCEFISNRKCSCDHKTIKKNKDHFSCSQHIKAANLEFIPNQDKQIVAVNEDHNQLDLSNSSESNANDQHHEEPKLTRRKPKRLKLAKCFNKFLTYVHMRPSAGFSPQLDAHSRLRNFKSFTVMISYQREEGQMYALALRSALMALGVSVYVDLFEIKCGTDWQDSLNAAISGCRAFVALVTPTYGETLWTSREVKLADVLGKQIIPVNFGQQWPPASLAIQFATLQYIFWLPPDAIEPNTRPKMRLYESIEFLPVSREENSPISLETTGRMRQMPEWPDECVESVSRSIVACLYDQLDRSAGRFLDNKCHNKSESGYDSSPLPLSESDSILESRESSVEKSCNQHYGSIEACDQGDLKSNISTSNSTSTSTSTSQSQLRRRFQFNVKALEFGKRGKKSKKKGEDLAIK